MVDKTWQLRVREKIKLNPKLKYGAFRKCRSRFSYHTFYIVNDGSNMAVENLKKLRLFSELEYMGFRG